MFDTEARTSGKGLSSSSIALRSSSILLKEGKEKEEDGRKEKETHFIEEARSSSSIIGW